MKFCIAYTLYNSDEPKLFFSEYRRIRIAPKMFPVSIPVPTTFNSRGAAQQYGDNYFRRCVNRNLVIKVTVITEEKALQMIKEKYLR